MSIPSKIFMTMGVVAFVGWTGTRALNQIKAARAENARDLAEVQAARARVVALPLDEPTKNYYLERLDEHYRGQHGGSGSIPVTVAEATERSQTKR